MPSVMGAMTLEPWMPKNQSSCMRNSVRTTRNTLWDMPSSGRWIQSTISVLGYSPVRATQTCVAMPETKTATTPGMRALNVSLTAGGTLSGSLMVKRDFMSLM